MAQANPAEAFRDGNMDMVSYHDFCSEELDEIFEDFSRNAACVCNGVKSFIV